MSLAAKEWTGVSIHKIMLAWLRAERSKLTAFVEAEFLSRLLDHPDLRNADENRVRLRLFYCIRNAFFVEIPPDTEWYEVCNLTDDDLVELRAINYPDWTDPADDNELAKVAARKKIVLCDLPSAWEPPILFGHDMNGPFSILEGNHRLTAYARSQRCELSIPVFVGLSPMRCLWNLADKTTPLMQDLFRR
jgi:hypothetical protein